MSNIQTGAERMPHDLSHLGFLAGRSEERFSRNAETDLVCRLLLEKKNRNHTHLPKQFEHIWGPVTPHRRSSAAVRIPNGAVRLVLTLSSPLLQMCRWLCWTADMVI